MIALNPLQICISEGFNQRQKSAHSMFQQGRVMVRVKSCYVKCAEQL